MMADANPSTSRSQVMTNVVNGNLAPPQHVM